MIPPGPDHLHEVVVVVQPRFTQSGIDRYDARIYASPNMQLAIDERSDSASDAIGELTLRGVESIRIRWGEYRGLLKSFHDGGKRTTVMRQRMFELVSPGLANLVEQTNQVTTRIWWSCASPEIEELPWEIFVDQHNLSFVRGLPSTPRALVPPRASLTVAVVACSKNEARRVVTTVENGVAYGDQPVRRAIEDAVRSGAEVLHLVADGTTLPSWDAVLDFKGNASLSVQELASYLRGSRVVLVVLSLCAERSSGTQSAAFRAFSHIGSAIDVTNVIAQIGPTPQVGPSHRRKLWDTIYGELGRTGSVEAAMRLARRSGPVPLALFLRQRLGREIAMRDRETDESVAAVSPQATEAIADAARELFDKLKAIEQRYPKLAAPLTGTAAFHEQQQKLAKLDGDLASWTTLADEEKS